MNTLFIIGQPLETYLSDSQYLNNLAYLLPSPH